MGLYTMVMIQNDRLSEIRADDFGRRLYSAIQHGARQDGRDDAGPEKVISISHSQDEILIRVKGAIAEVIE